MANSNPVQAQFDPSVHMYADEAAKIFHYDPHHFKHFVTARLKVQKFKDGTGPLFLLREEVEQLPNYYPFLQERQQTNGKSRMKRGRNMRRRIVAASKPAALANGKSGPSKSGAPIVRLSMKQLKQLIESGTSLTLSVSND